MTGLRISAGLILWASLAAAQPPEIRWDSPSQDSSGSMPLGNGDIGLNVWVEPNGDLLFYISKTDAWDESVRLLKLGRIRVKLEPAAVQPFRQVLKTASGEVEIQLGQAFLRVWVDANRPAIRVEAEGKQPFRLRASLEMWRTAKRVLEGREAYSAYGLEGGPEPPCVYPDTILAEPHPRLVWYHRNVHSPFPGILQHQGLESLLPKLADPLRNRTFGALMGGPGLRKEGPATLVSRQPALQHQLSVFPLTAQTETAAEWLAQLERGIRSIGSVPIARARLAHREWWRRFWRRSYIRVSGAPDAAAVTQGYALQRYMNACAGRGAHPIKFNGSIFTVDSREPKEIYDADYRRWGGPYWFQNTRLNYWPMLAAGDFDLMEPLFRMYMQALPLALARTPLYFNHGGAFFPETMYFWGAYANSNYGWKREGKPPSFVENTYIRHYHAGALELVALMLERADYTGDARFRQSTLQPFADAVLEFYDRHYRRDAGGKMRMEPAQSLETWQEVINPAPDIAGLRYLLPKLGGKWARLLGEVPPLPSRQEEGKTLLLVAEQVLGPIRNRENPDLYAIFPFRLFGVGKPDLETGRHTFSKRRFQQTGGWQQDSIQAACLGLTAEARRFTVQNFTTPHKGSRFPGFYGPNFDWVPDQDHPAVAMMALSSMLLQAEGRRIHLLPAWPRDWDVEFKLHAPMQTTLEGVYRGGKRVKLVVTPAVRARDVIDESQKLP